MKLFTRNFFSVFAYYTTKLQTTVLVDARDELEEKIKLKKNDYGNKKQDRVVHFQFSAQAGVDKQ